MPAKHPSGRKKASPKPKARARAQAKATPKASAKSASRPKAKASAKAKAKAKAKTQAGKASSKVAPRDAFAGHVASLLRRDPRIAKVSRRVGEFALEVSVKDADVGHVVFLENLFVESREIDPAERDAQLLARLSGLFEPAVDDGSWESVREAIVPVVRSSVYGLSTATTMGGSAKLVSRSLAPFIDVYLALDDERSMRLVTTDELETWGVTAAQAFATADDNARRYFEEPVLCDDLHGPLFHVDTNDSYESSRLAVSGLLASFAERVEGRPIAVVPEREQLWIGGDARPEAVARLADKAVREYEASTRDISPAIYTVDDEGRVVPYLPPPGHPHREQVRLGHVKLALREYAEQKSVLEKLHERDGVDVFVASLNGILRDDGRPIAWCMWGEGIESLLPEAELVMLAGAAPAKAPKGKKKKGEDEGWSFFVPWATVAATMGQAWAPEPGLHPPRIRPRAWPDAGQLARLRAAAVELADVR